MSQEYKFKGKRVTVHDDGQIFINGVNAKIKQWKSDPTRFSNLSGQEQKNLKGNTLEKALMILGLLPR